MLDQQLAASLGGQQAGGSLQAGIDTTVFIEAQGFNAKFTGEGLAVRITAQQKHPLDSRRTLQGANTVFHHAEHELAALGRAQRRGKPLFGKLEVLEGDDCPHKC